MGDYKDPRKGSEIKFDDDAISRHLAAIAELRAEVDRVKEHCLVALHRLDYNDTRGARAELKAALTESESE